VQGSVRRQGERVRITADLVSAETGRQLWSDAHEFTLEHLLDIQRSMAEQIAATIEPELARLEREAAVRRPPRHFDAWDCYQRGLWHLWGFTVPGMEEAEAMFRRALEIDPMFARAHGALGYVHLQSAVLRPPADRPALISRAMEAARTAVALDDQDCMNLCVLGRAHAFLQDYDEAIARLEQAVDLNPSFAQAWYALGFTLIFCGREEEAIACIERATDLSPRDPHIASFHAMRALAHFFLGDLDAAVALARQGARAPNAKHWSLAVQVAALGLLGREAELRRAVAELRSRHPEYCIESARADFFFCQDEARIERFLEGLRRAGVSETTPAAA
jgi:tetratricopeptide (TPR) repeat protein